MVNGIEIFRERFAGLEDQYVLIGGTACDLLYGQQGLVFRATKDFDIVLCVEALDPAAGFMQRFWAFVAEGKYQIKQEGNERRLYRFSNPEDKRFPKMLELFSRAPAAIVLAEDAHLTPIPGDEAVSSLSAILLDEASYAFLVGGTISVGGVRLATAERLIALKAHAWENLAAKPDAARKHRKDIYALSRLLVPATRIQLPPELAGPLRRWLDEEGKNPLEAKDPSLGGIAATEIHAVIRAVLLGANLPPR